MLKVLALLAIGVLVIGCNEDGKRATHNLSSKQTDLIISRIMRSSSKTRVYSGSNYTVYNYFDSASGLEFFILTK